MGPVAHSTYESTVRAAALYVQQHPEALEAYYDCLQGEQGPVAAGGDSFGADVLQRLGRSPASGSNRAGPLLEALTARSERGQFCFSRTGNAFRFEPPVLERDGRLDAASFGLLSQIGTAASLEQRCGTRLPLAGLSAAAQNACLGDVRPLPPMPVFEELVSALADTEGPGRRPLDCFGAVLCRQHLYESNEWLLGVGLPKLGARVVVELGKANSADPETLERLRQRGVRVSEQSRYEFRQVDGVWAEEEEVAEFFTRYGLTLKDNERLLVIDEGGRLLAAIKKRCPQWLSRIVVVEQTEKGMRPVDAEGAPCPLVDVARSWAKKKFEGPIIGEDVVSALLRALMQEDRNLPADSNAVVLGYGSVGKGVAQALARRGYNVSVFDLDDDARLAAARDGFATPDRAEALAAAQLVVGCTGHRSVTLDDYALLQHGTVLVSGSNGHGELSADLLAPIESQFAHRYHRTQDGRELLILRDGWAINRDQDIPGMYIQLTRCLMLYGAWWAAQLAGQADVDAGVYRLAGKVQRAIVKAVQASLATHGLPPLETPDFKQAAKMPWMERPAEPQLSPSPAATPYGWWKTASLLGRAEQTQALYGTTRWQHATASGASTAALRHVLDHTPMGGLDQEGRSLAHYQAVALPPWQLEDVVNTPEYATLRDNHGVTPQEYAQAVDWLCAGQEPLHPASLGAQLFPRQPLQRPRDEALEAVAAFLPVVTHCQTGDGWAQTMDEPNTASQLAQAWLSYRCARWAVPQTPLGEAMLEMPPTDASGAAPADSSVAPETMPLKVGKNTVMVNPYALVEGVTQRAADLRIVGAAVVGLSGESARWRETFAALLLAFASMITLRKRLPYDALRAPLDRALAATFRTVLRLASGKSELDETVSLGALLADLTLWTG